MCGYQLYLFSYLIHMYYALIRPAFGVWEGDDVLYIELHVWDTVRRSPLIVFSLFSYFDLCQTCRGKRNDGLVCKTYTVFVYQEHVIIVVENICCCSRRYRI